MKKIAVILAMFVSLITNSQTPTWNQIGQGLPQGQINTMVQDSNGTVYAGGPAGLYQYTTSTNQWNPIAGYPGADVFSLEYVHYYNDLTFETHDELIVGSDSIYMYHILDGTWSTIPGYGVTPAAVDATHGFHSLKFYPQCNANGYVNCLCAAGCYNPGVNKLLIMDIDNGYQPFAQLAGPAQLGHSYDVMEVYHDTLFLGGVGSNFLKLNAGALNYTTVSNDNVQHMKVYNDKLYTNIGKYYDGTLSAINANMIGGAFGVNNNLLYFYYSTSTVKVFDGTNVTSISAPSAIMCFTEVGDTTNGFKLVAGGSFTSPYANVAEYGIVDTTTTVGINVHDAYKHVNIYPNPCAGRFYVDGSNADINVYDETGRLIKTIKANGKTSIEIETKGLYIIQVGSDYYKLINQ